MFTVMFPFLPYRHISINTSLSLEAVTNILHTAVTSETPRFLLPFKEKKPFWGTISDHTFKIQRRIIYRNSFLPILNGQLISTDHGITIQIQMLMHPLVMLFMTVWFAPLVLGGLMIPLFDWLSTGTFPIYTTVWEMLTFGYLMIFFGFGIEAIIAERRLKQLFGVNARV